MALVDPARGAIIENTHVTQLTGLVRGDANKGQPIRLYRHSDAADYANIFGNVDTTNGLSVKIQYGDPGGTPVTLATFAKAGITLQSNDASRSVVISNSGVAITAPSASFSVNGQTITRGVTVYNVLDHGIVTGSNSDNAAANTAALAALWVTVGSAGGGVVFFPPGTYPFNATTLNHNVGSAVSISIQGTWASILNFYGTTGPFLDFATTSTHALSRCGIFDLRIQHAATPTTGATIRLNNVVQFVIDGVKIPAASTSLASIVCLQLTGSAGAVILNSKFETQQTGAVTPITIDVATSTATGGVLYVYNTDISGYSGASTGIRFANSGDIDTVILGPGTSIKDHATGILKTALAGNIENLIATGLIIDVCSVANVQLQPATNADIGNWIFDGCWFSGDTYNFLVDETGGGTVAGLQIENSYLTDADTNAILLGTGVDSVFIRNNRIASSVDGAGDWAVDINGTSANVIVSGNLISAGATAAGLLRINANVDPVVVNGNLFRAGADADGISFGGSTGASRVNANNAYLA